MAFRTFRNAFNHHHHHHPKSNCNLNEMDLKTQCDKDHLQSSSNLTTVDQQESPVSSRSRSVRWFNRVTSARNRCWKSRSRSAPTTASTCTEDADCNSNMSSASSTTNVSSPITPPSPAHVNSDQVGYRLPAKNCHRLVILGSSRVGKTSIVSRFLNNKYDDKYTPTIEDFHRKLYRIRGEVYQLDILDTSGNHPFPAMRRLSFLTGDLFILVYSIDNRDSFDEVRHLRDQILETKVHARVDNGPRMNRSKTTRIPMVIVGNKCDKESDRMVAAEEVTTFVSELASCAFLETSAKKNIHIEDVFCELFLLGFCQIGGGGGGGRKKGLPLRRRLSDAYGTIAPNARRPSLRTDLLILQSKTLDLSSDSNDSGSSWIYAKDITCVLQ